ncbi:MAG: SGNH/GDSL hydrolase family protein [Lewinellaceae bacterium]|nr:SGNH/GDSL hydrolase family protein [Leptospiraceae bacterium]MCB9268941.1 SGNH/GDSL hydrolase family protein [Lewinellaceae bacterium]
MNPIHNTIFLFLLISSLFFVKEVHTKRILCFGDSITAYGEWVEEVGSLDSFSTINAGRGGRRAVQARAELAPYLTQYPDLDLLLFFLGVNDLPARDPRPGDVKIAECVDSISAAIDLALHYFKPKDIVLIAPCNVNPALMDSINLAKGYDITPPLLARMEQQYQLLAAKKGISFLSLYPVVHPENYKDGLHPNQAGDREIGEAIKAYLLSR